MVGAAILADASDPGQIAACGAPDDQSWLCSTVYDLTGSRRATEAIQTGVRVVLIIVIAWVLARVARRIIKRVVRKLAQDETGHRISRFKQRTGLALLETSPVPSIRRALRAETMGAVLRSIVTGLIWATALVMVLDALGVNLAAIGIGVSIIGVAIGFGSQTLVKDFLSGFFMVVEDQYGVGDVIDAGVASGTVEGLSLRTTRMRDAEGVVWHVPNGEIRSVGNKSQQWSRALLDVGVSYDADLMRATEVIKSVADALWHDEEYGKYVQGQPEVWGVEQVTADQILIRLAVKTKPLEQWKVARELRARLKFALDEAGIRRAPETVITYRAEGGPPFSGGSTTDR